MLMQIRQEFAVNATNKPSQSKIMFKVYNFTILCCIFTNTNKIVVVASLAEKRVLIILVLVSNLT